MQRLEVVGASDRLPLEMTELEVPGALPVVAMAPDRVGFTRCAAAGRRGRRRVRDHAGLVDRAAGRIGDRDATVERLLPTSAQVQVQLETADRGRLCAPDRDDRTHPAGTSAAKSYGARGPGPSPGTADARQCTAAITGSARPGGGTSVHSGRPGRPDAARCAGTAGSRGVRSRGPPRARRFRTVASAGATRTVTDRAASSSTWSLMPSWWHGTATSERAGSWTAGIRLPRRAPPVESIAG